MYTQKPVTVAHTLTDLPNISIALGEALRRVGIATPPDLFTVGAENAWLRLHAAGAHDCIQSALALEGAIQGQQWQRLDPARRFQLMQLVSKAVAEPPKGS